MGKIVLLYEVVELEMREAVIENVRDKYKEKMEAEGKALKEKMDKEKEEVKREQERLQEDLVKEKNSLAEQLQRENEAIQVKLKRDEEERNKKEEQMKAEMEKSKEEKTFTCHHGSLAEGKEWKQPRLIAKSDLISRPGYSPIQAN